MLTRRAFIGTAVGGAVTLYVAGQSGLRVYAQELPGGTLHAGRIPQFTTPLPIPGTLNKTKRVATSDGPIDYYEIGVRQFRQQMLPAGYPATTVWGYGPAHGKLSQFSTPSATLEATAGIPVRVKWFNQLVDDNGHALPHLLAVDPTLHWANPERRPGHMGATTDSKPDFTGLRYVPPSQFTDPATQYTDYRGPVPLVAHLHGAVGVGDESDGYPEAWVLPDANDIPAGYARHGRWYDFFAHKSESRYGTAWTPGSQVSQYPNNNRATTLWFHDHALGITRLNVYAGTVGFYLVRDEAHGRPDADSPVGLPTGQGNRSYELALAIQDRSFNADGSLFYPGSRAFFDACGGSYVPETSIAPVWNPEFFGNTITVNGTVWPYATMERRRYRLRLLNGCGSRVLILDFGAIPGARAWQIGNDGGYLETPLDLAPDHGRVTLAPAERADLIVDFSNVREGSYVLPNLGPDSPYDGSPVGTFEPADAATTGRVLQFRVVATKGGRDKSLPVEQIMLPAIAPLPASGVTRRMALMEHQHHAVDGPLPTMAMLGILTSESGVTTAKALSWMDPVTENPAPGATETWEIYNFTVDAHPVHVHEVAFEVLDRAPFTLTSGALTVGAASPPHAGERGRKDTVLVYPGQRIRIKATFAQAGQYVWHCHVLEHEDNEMMRPYRIGPVQPGQPM